VWNRMGRNHGARGKGWSKASPYDAYKLPFFFSFLCILSGRHGLMTYKKRHFFFVNEILEEWKQEMDQILDNKDSWITKNI
jgi:hypothetical protein